MKKIQFIIKATHPGQQGKYCNGTRKILFREPNLRKRLKWKCTQCTEIGRCSSNCLKTASSQLLRPPSQSPPFLNLYPFLPSHILSHSSPFHPWLRLSVSLGFGIFADIWNGQLLLSPPSSLEFSNGSDVIFLFKESLQITWMNNDD